MDNSEVIHKRMLDNISNEYDKTEGSFFYDATKPAAIEFENAYIQLDKVETKLDIENLSGNELERFIYQRTGITRKTATKATTIVIISGQEGARISKGDLVALDTIKFVSLEDKTIGSTGQMTVLVECELAGTIGNVPAGAIKYFPVSIPGLTSVTNLEPVVNGYDAESDEELRERYYERIRTPATSGNKYHYLNWAKEVTGVGDAKVIPLWDGPGTVKVVIIDSNKQPASNDLVQATKEHIEEERPIGADVTVVSAVPKFISIEFTAIIDEFFTIQQVKERVEKNIKAYFEETAFKVDFISYARIGKTILDTEGVLDYRNLTINKNYNNILLEYEEVPVLDEVVIHE